MGIIKGVKGTNIDATEIREVPKSAGEISPVASSLVKRDSYGNIINHQSNQQIDCRHETGCKR